MNTLYNPTAVGPADVSLQLCGVLQVTTVTQTEYKKNLSHKINKGLRNLRKCFEKLVLLGVGWLGYPQF
jgi:hypothetical protein